jgi:hypothetical protein
LVEDSCVGLLSGALDGRGIPAGMNDAQVSALQSQRELGKEGVEPSPLSWLCGSRPEEGEVGSDGLTLAPEPVISMLPIRAPFARTKKVQLVIPEEALGSAFSHLSHYTLHDCWTIGAAIDQISDVDQPPSLGMGALLGIPQPPKELLEGVDLPMHIADEIDGTFEQISNQGLGKFGGHGVMSVYSVKASPGEGWTRPRLRLPLAVRWELRRRRP